MRTDNNRGVALIFSVLIVMVLLAVAGVFVLRTIHESRMTLRQVHQTKSFYLAEAGIHAGLNGLDNLINNFMLDTVASMNPSVVISKSQQYVSGNDGVGFLLEVVLDNGTPVLTLNETQAEYSQTDSIGDGSYVYNIFISEKFDPASVGSDAWDFSYDYIIKANGTSSSVGKGLVLRGDFTVRVQRDNFAKYALFTNHQTLPSGTNVWFTDKTDFAGPVHTNGRFNFALNPSGTFDGAISQVAERARFYNNGSPVLLDADFNDIRDVPVFNNGFTRDASSVSLSSPVAQQDMIDQATGGGSFASDGIYISNSSGALSGGLYVKGNGTVNLSVNGSSQPVYTIVQGATTKIVTVDLSTSSTTVETVGGSTDVYSGLPDGVDNVGTIIYVDGTLENVGGTVQSNTQLTISSKDDIVIQDHLVYETYTPAQNNPGDTSYAPPNAEGANNLLGIVSWNGDVRIGTSAPDNINIHATVLAKNGILQVDNYNDTGIGGRGTATLLGGVISDYYGAFGLFYSSTGAQASGYGRNFVYDERMMVGSAPPYFPTLNTFIAFTNDITDKMVWQEQY